MFFEREPMGMEREGKETVIFRIRSGVLSGNTHTQGHKGGKKNKIHRSKCI
jgi:hypothetical protein